LAAVTARRGWRQGFAQQAPGEGVFVGLEAVEVAETELACHGLAAIWGMMAGLTPALRATDQASRVSKALHHIQPWQAIRHREGDKLRPSTTQVDGRIDEAVDGGTGPRPQSPPGPSARKKIEPEISCEGLFLQHNCKKGISGYVCNIVAYLCFLSLI